MVLRGYPSSFPEHNYLDKIKILWNLIKLGDVVVTECMTGHAYREVRPLINILLRTS